MKPPRIPRPLVNPIVCAMDSARKLTPARVEKMMAPNTAATWFAATVIAEAIAAAPALMDGPDDAHTEWATSTELKQLQATEAGTARREAAAQALCNKERGPNSEANSDDSNPDSSRDSWDEIASYVGYAQTPHGKAARKRAHEKWSAKRKTEQRRNLKPAPLFKVISNWKTSCNATST